MRNKTDFEKESLITIPSSIFISLIFMFMSPLHPWIGDAPGVDSSVFKTVVLMMEKGYLPYKDSFDHKGPIIYFLNYLGNCISYYRGIWVVEVISLAITTLFMYKTARLLIGKIESLIVTLAALSLLFTYFENGNFTEEYAMPCIAFSCFVFADYFLNDYLNNLRIVLVGAGLGIVLMLRANMIAVWIVFCTYTLVVLLIKQEYHELLAIFIKFLLGVCLIIVPIIIWLSVNNDLSYFWYDYIVFNRQYVSEEGGRAFFSHKWTTFIFFVNTPLFLIGFFALVYRLRDKKNVGMNIAYLFFMVITVMLAAMGGVTYGHYGMVIVPILAYPLSILFKCIEEIEHNDIRKALSMIVGLCFICIMIVPNWVQVINVIPYKFEKRHLDDSVEKYGAELAATVDYIVKNTDEEQAISVYGNMDAVYVLSNRKHATQYSYQYPIGVVMPEIMDDYFNQLQEELPNVIVIEKGNFDDRMIDFLDNNSYHFVCKVNEENEESTMIYSR